MGDLSAEYVGNQLISLRSAGARLAVLDLKYCFRALENSDSFSAGSFNTDIFDCGIAAYLINPLSGNYDYSDLASVYTDAVLPEKKELLGKKSIDMFSYTDEDICRYMAYRAYVPHILVGRLYDILHELDMYKLYTDIELPCVYSLYTMEKNGIKVDRDALLKYGEKLKDRLKVITDEIYGYAGESFNINSPKQLGEILFEHLGLRHGKKTKTGYSTSVDVLEKIKNEHPIVPLVLEYRQLAKLDSTYVEGLSSCICSDGRIHGTFNQTVTATGRISSTEPNLQNIPTRYPLGKEIRRVFVPEDGYIFLDADYSQIELRVLAHMSGDETLINAYNQNDDIHSITASEVFGVPIDEVTPLMRRNAKAVNFGIVYGISSFGLGQDLDISRKEAESYIEKYFNTYKQVKLYLDDTVKFAKENGYSVTMFGRKRPIDELKSSNFMTRSFGERVAMNSPIQGTAADIMKLAMINVDRKLKEGGYKSRLVLQVHDELIIETLKEEFDAVKDILSGEMSNAAKLAVSLVVDVESGENWLEAK
jgi:DNA polymerase-1